MITAGDGEEDLQEFDSFLDRLWQECEPVGVLDETLVQRIASAGGDSREYCVPRMEKYALDLMGAGALFKTSNATDQKLSTRERLSVVQKCQSDLRRNHKSVEYLRVALSKVKSELASKGDLSEPTKDLLAQTFGLTDNVFVKVCFFCG